MRAINKPGELEGVRCATAGGRPAGAALLGRDHDDVPERGADGEAAIREISAAIYSTFDRLARSSEYGRIVSERDTGK